MLNHELRTLHIHMDLRTYTDGLPHGGMADFARRCDISPIYLSQLAARQDNRVPSVKLCNVMVRESAGVLTREELRPDDYWEHWPDLPAPVQQQAA
jgi:DNA-binding transcriptional regulator YdaS (Cro superfamily)